MKSVNISHWKSKDAQDTQHYVASYGIHDGSTELFSIDLTKQKGFYQLSEFVAPQQKNNFMIEQTNRAGTPKVVAFDKQSGSMLGNIKTNSLIDQDEEFVFELFEFSKTTHTQLMKKHEATPEDYIALDKQQNPAVLYIHLPKEKDQKKGLISKIKSMAGERPERKQNVFQVVILNSELCDERMCFAIGVVLHDRGGLQA